MERKGKKREKTRPRAQKKKRKEPAFVRRKSNGSEEERPLAREKEKKESSPSFLIQKGRKTKGQMVKKRSPCLRGHEDKGVLERKGEENKKPLKLPEEKKKRQVFLIYGKVGIGRKRGDRHCQEKREKGGKGKRYMPMHWRKGEWTESEKNAAQTWQEKRGSIAREEMESAKEKGGGAPSFRKGWRGK